LSNRRHGPRHLIVWSSILSLAWGAHAGGQPLARRAVDLTTLVRYPGFYHGQPVVLRAELVRTGGSAALVHPDEARALRVTGGESSVPDGRVEARGVFWDVGRLERDDPRVISGRLNALVDAGPEAAWPRPGELFALQLSDAFAVEVAAVPTLRDVALDGSAYGDREVTIVGQFRGRNLFGDVPAAPGLSRWDFVVKSADAAVWVTGQRPRGRGFDFDVNARIDTNRWLRVTGVVRQARGLVWLESVRLEAAAPPADPRPPETSTRQVGPPPGVVFSSPTSGEIDVRLDARIRIQFSRDMDPDSFAGRVRVSYADAPGVSPQKFISPYDAATRSITVQFAAPLPPEAGLRPISVELLGGITARDGAVLEPWTLSFEYGSN